MKLVLMEKSWFLLAGLILVNYSIFAADLPSAATPGGALPILEDELMEPFVYSDSPGVQEQIEKVTSEDFNAPRLQVRGFRIKGVKPHNKSGISQASVEQLVRTKSLALVNGEAYKGFTVSMFDAVNVAIGQFYREKGYFLARAYIPEQKIEAGIVEIRVVEGFVGQIVLSGNSLYSDEQLNEIFSPLQGEAVLLENVENAVFIANDYPGIKTNVLFGPGLVPGSAALVVNVDEEASKGYVTYDNSGSTFTGENRLRGNYQFYNVLGNADRIEVNAILTLQPQNSLYYDIAYQQPLMDSRYLVGGSYSTNAFDVGGKLEDLKISGESTTMRGFMTRIISRGRSARITSTVDLNLKSASSTAADVVQSEDKLTVLGLSGNYAGTSWSGSGAYQQISARLSTGLADMLGSMDSDGNGLSGREGSNGVRAGGDFSKLNIDYLRVSRLTNFQTLLLRLSSQTTSDILTSLEQFSLGGPDTVRAYPVSEYLADEALLFSAEWQADASPETPKSWLRKLQFSIFYDNASGTLNDPLTNDVETVSLSGLGFGIQIEPFEKLTAKLQYAIDLGDTPSDNMSLPFYFSMHYDF
jgi:hemolysin activation/secretion protein